MSPSVCLGGSVRTAFELGAAFAGKAVAQVRANSWAKASAQAKGKRTKPHAAGLVRVVSGSKDGVFEQVMGKLSRLG